MQLNDTCQCLPPPPTAPPAEEHGRRDSPKYDMRTLFKIENLYVVFGGGRVGAERTTLVMRAVAILGGVRDPRRASGG